MPDSLISLSKQVGLVWFFLAFIGIVAWAYWPSNKKKLDEAGKIPFDDAEDKKLEP
ncbi:cbb3-type cytochrome oxidase subunit 3 [Magnetococcus marinus]|uniref:cbb3-type cytochrome oxidase subunit 3 n=1 Tax=Magnetococcus marinus TaxID=1124597 RepID=UPI00003C57EE|nr:cbb3-type cytochrome c oxidase subunit 3 [Magnetococcus marinus]